MALCSREEAAFWADFSFLPKWGSLRQPQKVEHLRRHPCHELHYFVYHRDHQLFVSHILPLLQVLTWFDTSPCLCPAAFARLMHPPSCCCCNQ